MALPLPPMPTSRLVIIAVVLAIVLLLGLVFSGIIPGLRTDNVPLSAPLTFWGVLDDEQVMDGIIRMTGFPVTYKRFDPQTYETTLINALAAGKGPDLFMVHSSWLPKHVDKLAPAPTAIASIGGFRQLYPTVAEQDFAPEGAIFALPLSIDTLALLYNRDLFDSNGIAVPPKTWTEFEKLVPTLRRLDASGKLQVAAAAIGGSKNVNRGTDVLSALMLQTGTQMVSSDFSRATFANKQGEEALGFYTSFANPISSSYTWNDNFVNSIDGFADGKVAVIINYARQIPTLLNKNPLLKIGVAPLPQPVGATLEVNYASYWGIAVSNRAKDLPGAWRFATTFAGSENIVDAYATQTGHLPALRTLLAKRANDGTWSVFAKQALSARSWPQIDSIAVETAFGKAITDVITGKATIENALEQAQATITNLMQISAQNRAVTAPPPAQ